MTGIGGSSTLYWISNLDLSTVSQPTQAADAATAELQTKQRPGIQGHVHSYSAVGLHPPTHASKQAGAPSYPQVVSAWWHLQSAVGCWCQPALHQPPVCSAVPAAAWCAGRVQELNLRPARVHKCLEFNSENLTNPSSTASCFSTLKKNK